MMIRLTPFLVWSTLCAVAVSLKAAPLKLKSDPAVSNGDSAIKVANQWSSTLGKSNDVSEGAWPWALRWTARSMTGSIDATAQAMTKQGFEDRLVPRILEVLLIGFLTCILLMMLFSAVVFSGKKGADDCKAKACAGLTKVPLASHMYQGQDEHLDEELLERAWCAQAIARSRMNKLLAEAAKRPSSNVTEPRLLCSSSSEEESSSEEQPTNAFAEVPFAILIGEEQRTDEAPFALLMGKDDVRELAHMPMAPVDPPDAAAQKPWATLGSRKLRHPADSRPKNPRGSKSIREAPC